ncbi:hypothetical protein LC608_08205 [Nostoc sp. XA010]|uniref:hypothetical protein n=1 Tax=Nostoc sp. XA010 TaxID=2780407 RepID=UPI001E34ABB8|nr:hypothetical protein [Nostoc sp. XA010]MCC5656970.1 hypothetical protein [Nostoc sp. XA010]
MISKIKALTTDKEKNLQAPVEMEELSDGEAINVVGGATVAQKKVSPEKPSGIQQKVSLDKIKKYYEILKKYNFRWWDTMVYFKVEE